jgi:hypothetical protein
MAVHAGHILLRLRATRPPTMLPASGQFSPNGGSSPSDANVGAVLDALTLGLVESEAGSDKSIALLGSIQRLTTPDHGNDGRSQLVKVSWQTSLPWRFERDAFGEARLDLWFCPKLFDIRSDYDIWLMMENLIPTKPIVPRPPPPARLPLPGGQDSAFSFSLAGLMRAMESAGYAAATPPPGLRVQLYPFQTQSLQWMLDREKLPGIRSPPCTSAPLCFHPHPCTVLATVRLCFPALPSSTGSFRHQREASGQERDGPHHQRAAGRGQLSGLGGREAGQPRLGHGLVVRVGKEEREHLDGLAQPHLLA